MTRRKAKPLLPHEILPHLHSSQQSRRSPPPARHFAEVVYGDQQPPSLSQSSAGNSQCSNKLVNDTKQEIEISTDSRESAYRNDGKLVLPTLNRSEAPNRGGSLKLARTEVADIPGFGLLVPSLPRPQALDSPKVQLLSVRTTAGVVDLTHPSNNTLDAHSDCSKNKHLSLSNTSSGTIRTLKRISSSVRLSTSLDGKAQVVTSEVDSPSPPRLQHSLNNDMTRRLPKLQRSQSAHIPSTSESQEFGGLTFSWPRRAMGRSKDARAWEFYCDSDARNALTLQAEQEQRGSAVGELGLIRSKSNKDAMRGLEKRREKSSSQDSAKRKQSIGQIGQKPKLARTTSSIARLQTVNNAQIRVSQRKNKDVKPRSQTARYHDPSGDSDKENWEPGTQVSNVRRLPSVPNTQASGKVLQENTRLMSHSTSLGAVLNRENMTPRRRRTKLEIISIHDDGKVGGDVAAFTGEGSSPADDLDCVQNLLSLSQAAWQ